MASIITCIMASIITSIMASIITSNITTRRGEKGRMGREESMVVNLHGLKLVKVVGRRVMAEGWYVVLESCHLVRLS